MYIVGMLTLLIVCIAFPPLAILWAGWAIASAIENRKRS